MNTFLRIESASILAVSLALNWYLGEGRWLLFAVFAVLPELTWLGYIQRDSKAWWPSLVYNVAHSYTLPLVIGAALFLHRPYFLLGWVANIALMRALGLGFRTRKEGGSPKAKAGSPA
jgi:hypothetical protein